MSKNNTLDELIDIYEEPEIKLKFLKASDPSIKSSHINELKDPRMCILHMEGKNVDTALCNTLRRALDTLVPFYNFHRDNVKIDNTSTKSILNNDMIYNLIETLPIFDVDNDFDMSDHPIFLKYIKEKSTFNPVTEKSLNKHADIKISLAVNNNSDTSRHVTTHDLILTVNGSTKKNYQKRDPLTLMILGPKQKVYFQATANIEIGFYNQGLNGICLPFFEKISENSFNLCFKNKNQLTKTRILEKGCEAIIFKLKFLKGNVDKFVESDQLKEIVEVKLNDEDDTMGNLINNALQKCTLTKGSGYKLEHRFVKSVIIKYIVNKNTKNPIKVLIDCIDYLLKIFHKILKFVKANPIND